MSKGRGLGYMIPSNFSTGSMFYNYSVCFLNVLNHIKITDENGGKTANINVKKRNRSLLNTTTTTTNNNNNNNNNTDYFYSAVVFQRHDKTKTAKIMNDDNSLHHVGTFHHFLLLVFC